MESNQPPSDQNPSDAAQSTTQPAQPVAAPADPYCTKCKNFFGNPAMNHMCSKCFKESGGTLPQTASSATSANKNGEQAKLDTASVSTAAEE